jgi:hypothetical protein
MSRYRAEEYDLRSLERGLKLKTSEIVLGMSLLGWNINASTLSRLRRSSDVNVRSSGFVVSLLQPLFDVRPQKFPYVGAGYFVHKGRRRIIPT